MWPVNLRVYPLKTLDLRVARKSTTSPLPEQFTSPETLHDPGLTNSCILRKNACQMSRNVTRLSFHVFTKNSVTILHPCVQFNFQFNSMGYHQQIIYKNRAHICEIGTILQRIFIYSFQIKSFSTNSGSWRHQMETFSALPSQRPVTEFWCLHWS